MAANQDYQKELSELTKEVDELKAANLELAKSTVALSETTKKQAKTQEDLAKKYNANSDSVKKLTKAQKAEAEILRLATKEGKKEIEATVKLALEKKKLTDRIKEEITGAKAAAKAQRDFNKAHTEAIRINKQLEKTKLTEQLKKEKEAIKLAAIEQRKFNKAHAEAIRINNKLNQTTKKSGGLFRSTTKSILAAGVAFLSFRAAANVIKNSIKTIAQFEQGMSKVRAVAGALPKEFKALTANAKLLGQTTSKSALQVAGLQLEFSKLGFSTKEILNATDATIQLSIAAGSDLANSAVVAAGTVRGFGLDAKETQRVVDVMAKSFASSALDLEKFKTGMGVAAPVAKSFGKDIEFTTAQMSILADANIDASTAGTSLRNIFLELSSSGLTWEEGLAKINNSTNKNTAALDLFGKRGATAALVLADNIDKAQGLEEAYRNSAGAAKRMATIMEDNLIGDTTKLSSVWEGLILTLTSGGNSFNKFLRGAVQGVTNLISSFQKLVEASPVNEIKAEREEIIKLTGAIQNNYLSEEERLLALEKLRLLAPEVAKGVTLEAESYEELNKQLDAYLDKAIQRIAIASLEEEESKAIAKASKQRVFQAQQLRKAHKVLAGVNEEYRVSEGGLQDQLEGTRAILQKVVEAQIASGEAVVSLDIARTKEQEQLGALNLQYANLISSKEKEGKITEESINPLAEQIELLKKEFGLKEDEVELREDVTEVVKEETKAKKELSEVSQEEDVEGTIKRLETELAARLAIQEKAKKDSDSLADSLVDEEMRLADEELARLSEQLDREFELQQEAAKKELELEEEKQARKAEIRNAAIDAAAQIVSDRLTAGIDEDLARSQAASDAKQEILKDNLDKGIISEEEFAKESAKIDLKARQDSAKAEKKKALYDVAIHTITAIAKTFATLGWPAGIAGAAAMGLIGGFQASAISSKPIPKFEKGTNGQLRIATDAIVGEKGSELISTPKGDFLSPNSASMIHLPSGAEVFRHDSPETQAALSGGMSEAHYEGLVASNKEVVNAIKDISFVTQSADYTTIKKRNSLLKIRK